MEFLESIECHSYDIEKSLHDIEKLFPGIKCIKDLIRMPVPMNEAYQVQIQYLDAQKLNYAAYLLIGTSCIEKDTIITYNLQSVIEVYQLWIKYDIATLMINYVGSTVLQLSYFFKEEQELLNCMTYLEPELAQIIDWQEIKLFEQEGKNVFFPVAEELFKLTNSAAFYELLLFNLDYYQDLFTCEIVLNLLEVAELSKEESVCMLKEYVDKLNELEFEKKKSLVDCLLPCENNSRLEQFNDRIYSELKEISGFVTGVYGFNPKHCRIAINCLYEILQIPISPSQIQSKSINLLEELTEFGEEQIELFKEYFDNEEYEEITLICDIFSINEPKLRFEEIIDKISAKEDIYLFSNLSLQYDIFISLKEIPLLSKKCEIYEQLGDYDSQSYKEEEVELFEQLFQTEESDVVEIITQLLFVLNHVESDKLVKALVEILENLLLEHEAANYKVNYARCHKWFEKLVLHHELAFLWSPQSESLVECLYSEDFAEIINKRNDLNVIVAESQEREEEIKYEQLFKNVSKYDLIEIFKICSISFDFPYMALSFLAECNNDIIATEFGNVEYRNFLKVVEFIESEELICNFANTYLQITKRLLGGEGFAKKSLISAITYCVQNSKSRYLVCQLVKQEKLEDKQCCFNVRILFIEMLLLTNQLVQQFEEFNDITILSQSKLTREHNWIMI